MSSTCANFIRRKATTVLLVRGAEISAGSIGLSYNNGCGVTRQPRVQGVCYLRRCGGGKDDADEYPHRHQPHEEKGQYSH